MTPGKATGERIEVVERLLKEVAQAKRAALLGGGKDASDYVRVAQALMIVRRVARELRRSSA
jgi:hypothetical protein